MIECNDLYDYGYYIYQNKDYFKFSLDSILLAEYVDIKKNATVLDICSGNVPIPMILATREKTLKIDAVEIQEEIYNLGKMSIEKNGFTNINLYLGDAKEIELERTYDIVTCNPPYFKVTNTSKINKNEVKQKQRHELSITLEDSIKIAYKYLKDNGTFYMVERTERLIDTIEALKNQKFGIRNICFVYTNNNEGAEFFLVKSSKHKKTDPKISYINAHRLKTYKNIFKEVQK